MLVELRIHDFALIKNLSMRLGSSLNILTGETGAGKSIVIDAIQILLGSRARQIKIRSNAKCARVEGLFRISSDYEELFRVLADSGIECDDGEIVIRREVFRDGPSHSIVNGYMVPVSTVRRIGELLVDFHGQQEGTSLKNPRIQLKLLDAFADSTEQSRRVLSLYDRRRELVKELRKVEDELGTLTDRVKGLEDDLHDIDSIGISSGEEDELRRQKKLLENFERISLLSGIIFDDLSREEDGITLRLKQLEKSFEELIQIAGELKEAHTMFEDALLSLDEVSRRLGTFVEDVEYDPERLEAIRQRLTEIARVKRKFGTTIDDVMKYREWALASLGKKEELERERDALFREISDTESLLGKEAALLTKMRSRAAMELEKRTEKGMRALGISNGKFKVDISTRVDFETGLEAVHVDAIGRSGADRVRFMVSTNPGEPMLPLADIASGGELSRIMLAIKTAIAEKDNTPTLIFDEVDSGIGGEVGIRVGDKLSEIGRSHQILVVTHLAQIAVRADLHLYVEKVERKGEADIRLRKLGWGERTSEVARMLGGDPASSVSQRHAREMLQEAGRKEEAIEEQ